MPRTCRFVGQAKQVGYSQSPNSPTPTLSEPVPPRLPYSSLPSIQRAAEGEPDFWVEGYCRKKDGIQLRRERS